MSDEEQQCEECVPGLPAWMGTFADLMSLLMCFFVLLLSFAEMDVLKFKRLAGSMREAFGVQRLVEANYIPMGTSIIAQEFSPGKPDPTPLNVVLQQTVDAEFKTLEVMCEAEVEKALANACEEDQQESQDKKAQVSEFVAKKIEEAVERAETIAVEVAEQLSVEVAKDMVEIETKGRRIIIRVQEHGSFASGSAELQPDFLPVLEKLIEILRAVPGHISVEGHSDNVPIRTARYPSNWDLSAARALAVAHGLFDDGLLKQSRFSIKAFADTQPLLPNNSALSRSKNRRVEIVLQEQTEEDFRRQLREEAQAIESNQEKLDEYFDLDPDEIF